MVYSSWDKVCDGLELVILGHLLPFYTPLTTQKINILKKRKKLLYIYYYFTHVYHKWWLYGVWFKRYGAGQTEFFVIWGHFLPFHPTNDPKNQHFEKMKKTLRAITILHICTINDNYMMYDSSDVEHDRHNFLSFVATFCPFNSLTTQKIKI